MTLEMLIVLCAIALLFVGILTSAQLFHLKKQFGSLETSRTSIAASLEAIKRFEDGENLKLEMILRDLNHLFGLDPRPGLGHVLSLLSRYVVMARHPHMKVSSKAIDDIADGRLKELGEQLVAYQRRNDDSGEFSIPLIDSTHEFMAQLASELLTKGYGYVATSVLSSYGRVPNPSFQAFSTTLTEKVCARDVCGVRLYYCTAEPSGAKSLEMAQAAANGFQVRYLRADKLEGIVLTDFSLVFRPHTRVGGGPRADAAERIKDNPNDVIVEIQHSLELECGIEFDVQHFGDGAQRVRRIRVLGKDHPECARYVHTFNRDWVQAKVVPPLQRYSYFLSYRSEDRIHALELRDALNRNGFDGWYDKDSCGLGEFADQMNECATTIPVLVMLIGSLGPSKWQWREYEAFKAVGELPKGGDPRGILAPSALDGIDVSVECRSRLGNARVVTRGDSVAVLASNLTKRLREALG